MNGFINLFEKIGNDYILHFLCGFIVTTLFFPFNLTIYGMGATAIVALCKEWYDEVTIHTWDWKDFRFTCYGGLSAGLYYYLIYYLGNDILCDCTFC